MPIFADRGAKPHPGLTDQAYPTTGRRGKTELPPVSVEESAEWLVANTTTGRIRPVVFPVVIQAAVAAG